MLNLSDAKNETSGIHENLHYTKRYYYNPLTESVKGLCTFNDSLHSPYF